VSAPPARRPTDARAGFTHSAFSLRAEGRLESSAHFGTFVPRGALVDLLSKALLYAEVEAHWRADAPACAAPFTLLTPHVCTRDAGKRKAPDDADARTEKRVRTGSAEPTPAPAPPRHGTRAALCVWRHPADDEAYTQMLTTHGPCHPP
jgi:hypothetical protein